MRRKKHVGTLIGSCLTLMLLGACSGNNDTPGVSQDGNESHVELTLWLDQDTYAADLIQALESEFPDMSFNFQQISPSETLNQLSLDGPANLGGDIFLLPHDLMSRGVNQNLLLPLGESFGELMKGRVPESALSTVSFEGNYFGVPLTTESIALFYNKTLLEEYGLEVATSFEELLEQAAIFNEPSNNRFLLRYQAGDAYTSHFILSAHGYELFGPEHEDPNQVNFNSPEMIAALEFVQQIREILPVPSGDLDWDSTVGSFVKGETPYLFTGPWTLSDIMGHPDFEFGVTTLPTINGVQGTTFSGHIIGAVSPFSHHVDEARAVLEFMASDEGLQIIFEARGSIPAIIDGTTIKGLNENEYMLGILEQAQNSIPMPLIPEIQYWWTPAELMLKSVWDGLATPQEAADRAEIDFKQAASLQ